MGLKLRLNLFYDVDHVAVYEVLSEFWASKKRHVRESDGEACYDLHQSENRWVVLSWDAGWEWILRREAQLYVSNALSCKGFLIFVYDGNYLGYEFFNAGIPLDQYIQDEEPGTGIDWFPGKKCSGNPDLITAEFPFLSYETLRSYMFRDPAFAPWNNSLVGQQVVEENRRRSAEREKVNVPARNGDEFKRFDECAVLDFLRFLGVGIELREQYVRILAPKYKSFFPC